MLTRYIDINRILRTIVYHLWDLSYAYSEEEADNVIRKNIERSVRELERIWPKGLDKKPSLNLKEEAKLLNKDVSTIMNKIIPDIEDAVDSYFASQPIADIKTSITNLLHPVISANSYAQFRNGHYRDAVFNAFTAVYDLIRQKTKIDKDGSALISEVLSLSKPKIIISNLDTESGRDEQKGYLQILQGAYLGIRNPKAHSLSTDLNEIKAAQYLIFASLLARRIDEAHVK